MSDNLTDPSISRNEHVEENIQGKRVIDYGMGTSSLGRMPLPLIDVAWDYVGFSNPDANNNYQTFTFKSGGSSGAVVRTLALTYDGSNNVTSVTRT